MTQQRSATDSPLAPQSGWRHLLKRSLAPGLCLLYALLICVPWQLEMPQNTLDGSWRLLMNLAFVQRLHFGPDIIFTYGPWGFLVSRCYFPETYHLFIFAWICIIIVIAAAVGQVASTHFPGRGNPCGRPIYPIAWAVIVLTALAPLIPDFRDAFFGSLPVLYALLVVGPTSRRSQAIRMALAVVLSLAALMKFTFLAIALLVLVWGAIHTAVRFRKMAWDLPVFVLGFVFFWVLAGQPLSLIGIYLVNAASVASGYTSAMCLPEEFNRYLPLFILCFAGLAFLAAAMPKMRKTDRLSVGFVLLCVCFEAFKAGFVREDALHLSSAFWTLLVVLLIAAPVLLGERIVDRRSVLGAALVLVLIGAVGVSSGLPMRSLARACNLPARACNNLRIAMSLGTGRDPFLAPFDRAAARIRHDQPLPSLPGTVDIYSRNLSGMILSGLSYTPRPVFQSYSAYTPRLPEMNRQFLEGTRAPDWILFGMKTIDGRYPTLDDGPSWPALLSRYRMTGTAGDLLILQRRSTPRNVVLEPIGSMSGQLGQPLHLPTIKGHDLIWAQIDLQETTSYRLAEALYKPAYVYIDVVTVGGMTKTYQIVPAMTRTGFPLSPLIDSSRQFGDVSEGKWPADLASQQIATITIRYSGRLAKLARIRPGYEVRLSRLVIGQSSRLLW